ncbi:MAG TPA: YoaK family protein [Polyangiaceae bacterium]|nr:YoaK family protein [Polyangiaceae bacterium]
MFTREGAGRSDKVNRRLAGYLAFIGGYVNSAGFVLIGTFTSHVTGNVGRFAHELSARQFVGALTALSWIAAFFGGALAASMIVESDFLGDQARAYGVAVVLELALLVTFAGIFDLSPPGRSPLRAEALLLSGAMGMQNSLVTRLSGAVVRTTHLTRVVTDLGIEAARWFRWWRGRASRAIGIRLAFGDNPANAPSTSKIALLVTIAGAFTSGALLGSLLALAARTVVMVLPVVALAAGATYAFTSDRAKSATSIPPNSRA